MRRYELTAKIDFLLYRRNSFPKISFIVPFFNESLKILDKVKNLIDLNLEKKEIILVNDGSSDNSFDLLKKTYQLIQIPQFFPSILPTQPIKGVYKSLIEPDLIVIDKEHGMKYDANNCGLNAATQDIVIISDCDTFINKKSFFESFHTFFLTPNVVAAGVSVRIKNGCLCSSEAVQFRKFPQSLFSGIQALEYLRSFFIRLGIDGLNTNFIIAGAFVVFNRDILMSAGGYSKTVSDDLEIILRLQRIYRGAKKKFKIFYIPDPLAWTEVPESLSNIQKQRIGWHRGLMDAFWFHRCLFLNPKYGLAGMLAFPFGIFGEILEPVMEVLGYASVGIAIYLGLLNIDYFFLLIGFTIGFNIFLSISCLLIEELSFNKFPKFRAMGLLVIFSLIENLFYRQLSIIWRLKGIFQFIKDFKQVRKESIVIKKKIKKFHLP